MTVVSCIGYLSHCPRIIVARIFDCSYSYMSQLLCLLFIRSCIATEAYSNTHTFYHYVWVILSLPLHVAITISTNQNSVTNQLVCTKLEHPSIVIYSYQLCSILTMVLCVMIYRKHLTTS